MSPVKIYRDNDADLSIIRRKNVGIIGYGNQGAAQACNLRDQEVPLVIGLRLGSSHREKALADGHRVVSIAEAAAWGEVVMLLIADEAMPEVFTREIAPHLRVGSALGFAHGFALHFNTLVPPPSSPVFMVAPKGPGYQLRQVFLAGKGLPCLIACSEAHGPETLALALSYAKALGCTRQGALLTSFREETETDLFGEQAVLCGGVPSLLKAAFSTLVEAGYSQELAYIECVYELKLIVDLLEKGGLSFLRQAISNTAEFGSYGAGDLLVDAGLREKMQGILHAIQSGAFAAAWMEEYRRGSPELMRQREEEQKLPIERCGASLRRDLLHG